MRLSSAFALLAVLSAVRSSVVDAAAPPLAAPESVGFAAPRLQRLEAYMHGIVDRGERAGIVTIVGRGGHIVQLGEYGLRDIAGRKPMRADTLVRISAMTEPVTAVAVMMLYEQGLLQLEDPIGDYIPELASLQVLEQRKDGGYRRVPAASPVTIHQLLTHVAGFAYAYPAAAHVTSDGVFSPRRTLAEAMPRLARLPLLHQPGTAWTEGPAADVLARLVEVLAQQPFDQFLEQRLFRPLNMVDTAFKVPADKRDRLAEVYAVGERGSGLAAAAQRTSYDGQGRLFSGSDGLVSTALDFWSFAQMLANGGELDGVRILSPATVALMFRNQLGPGLGPPPDLTGHGFGLGLAVLTSPESYGVAGTSGLVRWGGALGTTFWIDPDKQIVAILMSQESGEPSARLTRAFQALVYQAVTD
jgi:CubicO group peptidase (beta-lactamase class C family)